MAERSPLSPDRFFSAEPAQRKIARQLYDSVLNLPILCPCLKIDAWTKPGQDPSAADPCELLILSDDYFLRHLSSLGIILRQNAPENHGEKASLHRKIWQAFADNLFSLRGMPADIWLSEILFSVFGIKDKLTGKNAQRVYDGVADCLKQPEFRLSKLLERFNIESIGLLESPTNPTINLNHPDSGGKIIPCFNPDALFWVDAPDWCDQIDQLAKICQVAITDYSSFLRAVQKQRLLFKSLGATTIVQSVYVGVTTPCTCSDLDGIFTRALHQEAGVDDGRQFSNHLLLEMASMSIEDNLVLQLQMIEPGVNAPVFCSTPSSSTTSTELMNSTGLKTLLEQFGHDTRVSLILFADEMHRFEGAINLADRFPSIKIGTPRWFFNGLSSIQDYFDACIEAIGIYKSTGLNNLCGSFLSLPAQHDIWRRSSANWLARLVVYGLLDLDSAYEMTYAMAYGLAKSTYKLH